MALKNVPAASARTLLLATNPATATTAAATSAKSGSGSAANAALANAGASDSASTPLAADFLALLTGFGAQAAPASPTTPAKAKANPAPPTFMPAVAAGSAGAAPPAAFLATAQLTLPVAPAPATTPATATPSAAAIPPSAPAPSANLPATTVPSAPPSVAIAPAPPPPTMPLPTVMPAAAPPASAAPARAEAAPESMSATAASAAAADGTAAAASADSPAPSPAPAPAPAPDAAAAWLSSSIRVPTLQPAAASLAPSAATFMGATAANAADESDSTGDPVETAETADGPPDMTKSVTEPVAFALAANAPLPDARSDSTAATPADRMSATAAAASAQAGPLQSFAHSQPATDARAPAEIRAPVGSPAWTEELGTQLTWMTSHGQDSASLRLSPEHLGPVEVRIDVRDGAASVWFGAAHPDTRSALEQSLPRLRELFAASGMLLADAGVARDAPRQNARPAAPVALAASAGDASISTSKAQAGPAHSGLVDTYV